MNNEVRRIASTAVISAALTFVPGHKTVAQELQCPSGSHADTQTYPYDKDGDGKQDTDTFCLSDDGTREIPTPLPDPIDVGRELESAIKPDPCAFELVGLSTTELDELRSVREMLKQLPGGEGVVKVYYEVGLPALKEVIKRPVVGEIVKDTAEQNLSLVARVSSVARSIVSYFTK